MLPQLRPEAAAVAAAAEQQRQQRQQPAPQVGRGAVLRLGWLGGCVDLHVASSTCCLLQRTHRMLLLHRLLSLRARLRAGSACFLLQPHLDLM